MFLTFHNPKSNTGFSNLVVRAYSLLVKLFGLTVINITGCQAGWHIVSLAVLSEQSKTYIL